MESRILVQTYFMKNILVPVDFSEVSHNAASFAASLGDHAGDARLILYNMFESYVSGSDGSPISDDTADRRAIRLMALNNIKLELQRTAAVSFTTEAEEGVNLSEKIGGQVKKEAVDLVVMGVTGSSRIQQIIVGSNALRVSKHAECPVLVIPPKARFTGFKKILMAVDLDSSTDHLPKEKIESVLSLFPGVELHIAYLNKQSKGELCADQEKERVALEKWLAPYSPVFHSIHLHGFVTTINEFVEQNNIDLLMTVPRKISYMADLFKHTHTEQLGYRCLVPFIAVH